MRHGEQCVMMPGMPMMPVLFVHSLDTQDSVSLVSTCTTVRHTQSFFLLTDATAFAGGRFGQGTGPIFVDNTACSGNEPRLLNCGYDTDTTDCTHAEDAGLRCSGRCKFVPVLLHIIRLRAL